MANDQKKDQPGNPAKDNKGKDTIKRREFLISAGNTAIGIAALGSLGVTLDFLTPKVLLEIPNRFKIGTLATMPPNSVTFDPEHRLFVFRDKQGYFYAVSSVCTHLGCNVEWKKAGISGHPEGVIACPCHGSIFNKLGNVLSGPAPKPLDRFKMYLEDGKLIVDMEEKVSEEEMILKV